MAGCFWKMLHFEQLYTVHAENDAPESVLSGRHDLPIGQVSSDVCAALGRGLALEPHSLHAHHSASKQLAQGAL